MTILQILILACVQGFAELLPVSSSAHVIVAEKLMGLDPSTPAMTFLLVMLHTGTMFAVLLFFWRRWWTIWTSPDRMAFIRGVVIATGATGVVGLSLKWVVEKTLLGGHPSAEIEHLFGNMNMIACALATVGVVIFWAGGRPEGSKKLTDRNSFWIGAMQGVCLPFRGFSRSGATISIGLAQGISRALAEEFSFALAVVLTPPVIVRSLLRLMKAHALESSSVTELLMPGLLGMIFSFGAGLLALRWLSNWMERGRWRWFSYYCWAAAIGVYVVGQTVG